MEFEIMALFRYIMLLSASIICAYFLLILNRFLNEVWWTPIYIQYFMRSQGVRGPPYKFICGNNKEISNMRKHSISRAMDDLSHDIFARIFPDVDSWVKVYGKNYLNWNGTRAQLIVTEADLVKEILCDKNGCYPKRDLESHSKKLFGDGLVSSKGEKWIKMRKLANQVFHAESLKNMMPAMVISTEIMLEKWKEYEEKEIEVSEEFRVLTSEIISKTAFGSSYLEGKNIFEMLVKMISIVMRNLHVTRFPGISRILKSCDDVESDKLEQGIKDCITHLIEKREQEKNQEEVSFKGDFLGKLLEANGVTVEDVIDECKTFYFAGHETTTSLLGWSILLLAIHKDWQEKAREEVNELFGQKNPRADGIARLKIMNMILEESLRLYPPVPTLYRKVGKRVQLGKLTLPPDMDLLVFPLGLHHDPQLWGEDYYLFKPERFAGGVAKATKNHPVAFLPFGLGPRTCAGLNFATVEAKIALSMILQRYKFSLSPNYVHSPANTSMILPQHGIKVILHKIY